MACWVIFTTPDIAVRRRALRHWTNYQLAVRQNTEILKTIPDHLIPILGIARIGLCQTRQLGEDICSAVW